MFSFLGNSKMFIGSCLNISFLAVSRYFLTQQNYSVPLQSECQIQGKQRHTFIAFWMKQALRIHINFIIFQFSSVAQLCPTLCDPMNRSMPGLSVRHQHPEFTQTNVHRVGDAIQPSHPLSPPSPPASSPSQHPSLFWVNSSHEVAKVLEFQLQHQSFQWTPRTDFL